MTVRTRTSAQVSELTAAQTQTICREMVNAEIGLVAYARQLIPHKYFTPKQLKDIISYVCLSEKTKKEVQIIVPGNGTRAKDLIEVYNAIKTAFENGKSFKIRLCIFEPLDDTVNQSLRTDLNKLRLEPFETFEWTCPIGASQLPVTGWYESCCTRIGRFQQCLENFEDLPKHRFYTIFINHPDPADYATPKSFRRHTGFIPSPQPTDGDISIDEIDSSDSASSSQISILSKTFSSVMITRNKRAYAQGSKSPAAGSDTTTDDLNCPVKHAMQTPRHRSNMLDRTGESQTRVQVDNSDDHIMADVVENFDIHVPVDMLTRPPGTTNVSDRLSFQGSLAKPKEDNTTWGSATSFATQDDNNVFENTQHDFERLDGLRRMINGDGFYKTSHKPTNNWKNGEQPRHSVSSITAVPQGPGFVSKINPTTTREKRPTITRARTPEPTPASRSQFYSTIFNGSAGFHTPN